MMARTHIHIHTTHTHMQTNGGMGVVVPAPPQHNTRPWCIPKSGIQALLGGKRDPHKHPPKKPPPHKTYLALVLDHLEEGLTRLDVVWQRNGSANEGQRECSSFHDTMEEPSHGVRPGGADKGGERTKSGYMKRMRAMRKTPQACVCVRWAGRWGLRQAK